MASNEINIPAREMAQRITVAIRITGLKMMSLRFKIGALFCRLGALIAGVQLEVILDEGKK